MPPAAGDRKGGRGRQPRRGGGGRRDDDRVRELSGPLGNVLKRLPDIEREVIQWRMGLKDGHPHDLADTARQVNLTLQEAREIEQRAFERIREVVPLKQLQKFLES